MSIITVMIAEDCPMFRDYLVEKLSSFNIQLVGVAENGKVLLELLAMENRLPDIILLDLEMPEMNGNETLEVIKTKYPSIKVVILSSFSEGGLVNDFIEKGANSYVAKGEGINAVVETIRNTKYLHNYTNISKKQDSFFTVTELRIIPYILQGKTNREIAISEGKAERTIEGCRARLYEKTNSANAAEFSKFCTKMGLYLLGSMERGPERFTGA